jgi:predicted adenine nucleotide alpha hydrolase (AANH) superfamily ATPase
VKILFHTCCAPCSVQCLEVLGAENHNGTKLNLELFWFNPNIHPYTEYRSRKDALGFFAEEKKIPLTVIEDYGLRSFVSNVEKGSSHLRCAYCYRLRLEKTAHAAAENSFDAFSTTLLISPYQDHELIKQTGEKLAAQHGLQFFYRDFRPLFRKGQKQARAAGLYMQKYCGCIYSEQERYLGKSY